MSCRSDLGKGHVHDSLRRRRAVSLVLLTTVAVVVTARPAHSVDDAALSTASGGSGRSTARSCTRSRSRPSVYGPGHRGADLAAAPGTPVRAANDGVVSFAGSVAGTLHVTVAHAGGLRTSYSFLASVRCAPGRRSRAATSSAPPGGERRRDHDGAVLHFGLRVGDRYVDPMQLFRPDDLTKLVHLVPADEPLETPWSPAGERRDLQSSLHLPSAGPRRVRRRTPTATTATPIFRSIGDAVDAVCDVGAWVGDHAGDAVDAGIDFLDATTDLAGDALDDLRAARAVGVARRRCARFGAVAASALARTPAGQLALDIVAIGRRFVDTVDRRLQRRARRPTAPGDRRTG